jgi:hypothetical protein
MRKANGLIFRDPTHWYAPLPADYRGIRVVGSQKPSANASLAELECSCAAPAGLRMNLRRLRSLGGLAVAIVPCAIIVHLAAEAAASGREGLTAGFIARHAYFIALFALTAAWFAATVGLGHPLRERRRRCALVRADLDGGWRPQRFLLLVGANLGFFVLTQAAEGLPILSGAVAFGLAVALAGSLLSALLVFLFGGTVIAAALEGVIGRSPFRRAPLNGPAYRNAIAPPRHATDPYTLFVPNRPPPIASRI